jgi:hypothetical protein
MYAFIEPLGIVATREGWQLILQQRDLDSSLKLEMRGRDI